MSPRQRVRAAYTGQPVDQRPVAAPYVGLYHQDHFGELTGRLQWQVHSWLHASPEDHVAALGRMIEQAPFDMLQPQLAPSREDRERIEIVRRGDQSFRHHKREDRWEPIVESPGHPIASTANEEQRVFDVADIRRLIIRVPAECQLAAGYHDYIDAAVGALGDELFIVSGGVATPFWDATFYLGVSNLLAMAAQRPAFVDDVCRRILECSIENIRAFSAAGADAIYVDATLTTSDMISVPQFERFALPYITELVAEIHRHDQLAYVYYFGGVADRLDLIASSGADALWIETSMKGYVNDIDAIADAIGSRACLHGNIDPYGVLERGSDARLEAEIRRQAAAGVKARGFVMSTGSPITPGTPLARVRRFIELARA